MPVETRVPDSNDRPLKARRTRLMLFAASATVIGLGYLLAPESALELPPPPEAPAPIFQHLVPERISDPSLPQETQEVARRVAPSVVRVLPATGAEDRYAFGLVVTHDGDVLTAASPLHSSHVMLALADGPPVSGDVTLFDPDANLAIVRMPRTSRTDVSRAAAPPPAPGDLLIGTGPLASGPLLARTFVAAVTPREYALGGVPPVSPLGMPLFTADGGAAAILIDVGEGRAIRLGVALERVHEVATGGPALPSDIGVRLTASPTGTVIDTVFPGSPAADAKLTAGDVVVAIDGAPTPTPADAARVIRSLRRDAPVMIEYERRGRRRTVELTAVSLLEAARR